MVPIILLLLVDIVVTGVALFGVSKGRVGIVKAVACYAFVIMILNLLGGTIGAGVIWFALLAIHTKQLHVREQQRQQQPVHFEASLPAYPAPPAPVPYAVSVPEKPYYKQ